MLSDVGILFIGLVLLYAGSEFLVRGAASTALLLSIRPVVVGLTVVAFATSAPELLVSLVASVRGAGGISVGNILGSNVINIALVLGISAMIKPITINRQIIRFDLPYMLGASFVFWILCMDGYIGYGDGVILLVLLVVFLFFGIKNSKEKNGQKRIRESSPRAIAINCLIMVAGLVGLAKGAEMVVQSAIVMARGIGLSEAFIGISVVALGTSLPELATSAVAASRGESDLSVGNVVGSNLFNICLVMGVVGILNPMPVEKELLVFEFPCMVAIAMLFALIAILKGQMGRKTGFVLIFSFVSYLLISYVK
ncbi:KncA [Desulforapulum autotrophicum HRM2]|uniref:KncA n=1 Tax=Desulforapulum autotrophicum (strain ATCC 43914 / DSM 3382 / VKM B-1955 / HRM2) TaxID=177437 RepID=C0QGV6_DESAH|nr:calcium/sodium antiporter [Desulforapulum autotrophicum]ACN15605.1 KncA [Desulforapulum autotrophicum HRM2]